MPSNLYNRVCRQCGKTFKGGPRAWYCPNCRIERRRESNRQHKQTGTARPLGSIDRCEKCGKGYVVNSARQRYCRNCAKSAVTEVDRVQGAEYYNSNKDWINQLRKLQRNTRVCPMCGKLFVSTSTSSICSDACKKERNRRRAAKWRAEHPGYYKNKNPLLPSKA